MKLIAVALLFWVYLGLSAVVGGHEWPGIAFSYALLWPTIFAFVVLPGVLIGSRMRTWQSSVILTEIVTIVAATMIDHPTVEQLFRPLFVMHLAIAHLALFHHSCFRFSLVTATDHGGPRSPSESMSAVARLLFAAIHGTVRMFYERDIPPRIGGDVESQLTTMCRAYVAAAIQPEEREWQ